MMKNFVHNPIILVIGTRPEAIKMIPVYVALKKQGFSPLICSTLQHDQLLMEVFEVFGIQPDINLRVMRIGQDLFYLTQVILQKCKEVFTKYQPSLVMVHGDTTSTMAASLAAFYLNIPIAHVEAGLRTDNVRVPFPEELNRRIVGLYAQYHFAPTPMAAAHLLAEGVLPERVFCTGNTVVDALYAVQERIRDTSISIRADIKATLQKAAQDYQSSMLFTVHRRESFDGGLERIFAGIQEFLYAHPEVFCVYPFHPNPQVISALEKSGLALLPNIMITEPILYSDMVYVLHHVSFVATDSGGIQEEAISLGKRVVVLREKTERMEGIWAGYAQLAGTDSARIIAALTVCLDVCNDTVQHQQIYGDGHAAEKITQILLQQESLLEKKQTTIQKREHEDMDKQNMVYANDQVHEVFVSIIGLGYIGLPTAIIAADSGLRVLGYDINADRVAAINRAEAILEEPELFERLQPVILNKQFTAFTQLQPADYFIIAVPTPFKEHRVADLSYVYAAADAMSAVLKKHNTVIIESTIPVGATQKIADYIETKTGLKAGIDWYMAHCPERVLPGKIFEELVKNDRIIGGINTVSAEKAAALYRFFVEGELYSTSDRMAEMTKLIENSSRDVNIAFAHEVAAMARQAGVDPYELIGLANKHPRVNILSPSAGVGGHCIAVDPWFLIESFPRETALLQAARAVNDDRPHTIINDIIREVQRWEQKHTNRACTVLLLGLTYKPDIDDMRESPALFIAQTLHARNDMRVLVCEPMVSPEKLSAACAASSVSIADGIAQADVIVYLVGHTRFKMIDRKKFVGKIVRDFCGILHAISKERTAPEQVYRPASSTSYQDDMQNGMVKPTSIQNSKEHDV